MYIYTRNVSESYSYLTNIIYYCIYHIDWGSREIGNTQHETAKYSSKNTELCEFLKNIQTSLLNTLKR